MPQMLHVLQHILLATSYIYAKKKNTLQRSRVVHSHVAQVEFDRI